MPQLIQNNAVSGDPWQTLVLAEDEALETLTLPAGDIIFPLAVWLARKTEIISTHKRIGLLRQRYAYQGELRAVGDVLHDQLFFMKRVGFDSFALKDGKDASNAIAAAFTVFGDAYQGATTQPQPAFRRRA